MKPKERKIKAIELLKELDIYEPYHSYDNKNSYDAKNYVKQLAFRKVILLKRHSYPPFPLTPTTIRTVRYRVLR